MSSYKNAVKSNRRKYRERAQPENRKKLGLLEKHQDYVLRAKDYHRKEDMILKLSRKAYFRNPDEFYFKMNSARKVNGVYKLDHGDKNYKKDELVEMKIEDITYLNMRRQMELKKIERLQSSLHLGSDTPKEELKSQHTVFVDTIDDAINFDEEKYFDTPKEFLTQAYNRPKKKTIEEENVILNSQDLRVKDLKKIERKKDLAYKELVARTNREAKLQQEISKLELKKNLIKNPNVIKMKKDGKVIYKWRTQRAK